MADTASHWRQQAITLRGEQRLGEARVAADRAVTLAPHDPVNAFLRAQVHYEQGLPAADLFRAACALSPDHLELQRNYALAQASEGQVDQAISSLASVLRGNPAWLDGHRVLAALKWVSGDTGGYDAAYAEAVHAAPQHHALWLGWFAAVAQQRDWARAAAIIAQAAAVLGEDSRAIIEARLFMASEQGDVATTEAFLARTADWPQPFVKLAGIRHALRMQRPEQALALALPMAQADPASPLAGQVWPYVSVCWRLLGDERAAWLDGDPLFVRDVAVGLSAAELADLAVQLRALHQARLPYAEQSVRGGTQTDRSVLLRHEPILQQARAALLDAMADYVRALPPNDPAHPLLGRSRAGLRISGSWSVRLTGGGFNVAHSHPHGWISSAFYVALPDQDAQAGAQADAGGPADADGNVTTAGHFQFGAPPPELGLDLAPYGTLAPRVGHLVMFPSTLWHGTVPFAQGERLNIAFDVVPA